MTGYEWACSEFTAFVFRSQPVKVPSFMPMTKYDGLVILSDKTGIWKFLSKILFIFVNAGCWALVTSQALTWQSALAEKSTSWPPIFAYSNAVIAAV